MESDDLSLFQIEGEDDLLLNNDALRLNNDHNATPRNDDFFLCSPLQTSGSNCSRSVSSTAHPSGPSSLLESHSSYSRDNCTSDSKETANGNKLEMPNLSIVPQKMKRKKKGGGYNLRKSLAWDRAFFTEEGVLDPLELSMISGNVGTSNGEMLSVIHEEATESLSCDLEEKPLKGTPSRTKNLHRNTSHCLSPKPSLSIRDHASPASSVKRKVPSAQDVNRGASKRSGCPRPVPLLPMKRPATLMPLKPTTKDDSVSKIPVPKCNPSVLSGTVKSVRGASDSKHSQGQRAVGIQKSATPNGSPKNTRSVVNKLKAIVADKSFIAKSSIQQARRNLARSVLKKDFTPTLRREPVTEPNNGLESIPNPLPHTTCCPLNHNNGGSNKVAASSTENASHIDRSKQTVQIQTAKPSGLRMPSPSLGFFGQKKVTSLQEPVKTSHQQYNLPESKVSNMNKLCPINTTHGLRPPIAPGKLTKVANDDATIRNVTVLCSSSEGSVPSSVNSTSHEKLKSSQDAEAIAKQNVEMKLATVCPRSNDLSLDESENPPFVSHPDPGMQSKQLSGKNEVTEIHFVELKSLPIKSCGDVEMKLATVFPRRNDASLDESETPFVSHPDPGMQSKQLSGENDVTEGHFVELKGSPIRSCGVSAMVCPGNKSDFELETTSRVLIDHLSSTYNGAALSQELPSFSEPSALIVDQVSHDTEGLQTHHNGPLCGNKTSEDFENISCIEVIDIDPTFQEYHESNVELEEDANHNSRSHAGPSQASFIDRNLAQNSHFPMMDSSSKVSLDSVHDEMPEPSSSCIEREAHDQHDKSSYVLHQKGFSSKDSHCGNAFQSVKTCVSGSNNACVSESERPITLGLIANQAADNGFDMAKSIERIQAEYTPSKSLDSQLVLHSYNCFVDTEIKPNIEHSGQDPCLELHRMEEDQLGEEAIGINTEVDTICPKTEDFRQSWENALITSQPSFILQDGEKENEHCSSQVKYDSVISNLQHADSLDFSYELDNSPVQIDTSSSNHYASNLKDRTDVNTGSLYEADREAYDNQNSNTNQGSLFSYKDHFHEEPKTFDNSKVKYISIGGLESPTVLSPHDVLDEANNKADRVSNLVEKSIEGSLNLMGDDDNQQSENPVLDTSMRISDNKDETMQLKQSDKNSKQNALAIKPPPNAVPFSEEWLAAVEAAGEEILTKKSGAVQHSPPDKSQPEPGPWSPVKKKNNQGIGPFDCTKYTNTGLPPDSE